MFPMHCWEPCVQNQLQRCFCHQFGVFWYRFGVFCHQFGASSACFFAAFAQPQVSVVAGVPFVHTFEVEMRGMPSEEPEEAH